MPFGSLNYEAMSYFRWSFKPFSNANDENATNIDLTENNSCNTIKKMTNFRSSSLFYIVVSMEV